jgi:hypothetical protein
MKYLSLIVILFLNGCVGRRAFMKFQYEELVRDEKIVQLLNQMTDNQLIMAKTITAQEAIDLREDRRFIHAGKKSADKTNSDFESLLDEAQRQLDSFMEIGKP